VPEIHIMSERMKKAKKAVQVHDLYTILSVSLRIW